MHPGYSNERVQVKRDVALLKSVLAGGGDECRYRERIGSALQMTPFALRAVGREALSEEMISRIRRILSTVPTDYYLADVHLAPEWIQRILTDLIEDQQDVHGTLKPTV